MLVDSVGPTKANAIKTLNNYGPFYLSHNPLAYCSLDGSHAILGIGYDKDYLYFKNSWSSSDTDISYTHYGKMTWSAFDKYSRYIGPYSARFWNDL